MPGLDLYSAKFDFARLERDDGILQVQLHSEGGPPVWTTDPGGMHERLGELFYEIAHDTENHVVILTGTGDEFLTRLEYPTEPIDAQSWFRIFKEGKDLLHNLLDIEVPVIAAVNGPAWIHAELATLSDIVIASEHATFADKVHVPAGVVPGDGVHVWWQMLLGPNRGRHFLLSGREIDAREALALGVVAEIVPHAEVMTRAWEIARDLRSKPPMMLRYARAAMTQHIKRRLLDDLGYGLMLEGMGILAMTEK